LKDRIQGLKRAAVQAGEELISRAEPMVTATTDAAASAATTVNETVTGYAHRVRSWFGSVEIPGATAPAGMAAAIVDIANMTAHRAPVVWLLGKTGAGKSSLIATLTGATHAEIGNGYVSCTKTSELFDFPQGAPLLRFLDTRGLGEPGYDPKDDIAWHTSQAHLIIVVMKVADPSQQEVVQAVHAIRAQHPKWPVVVAQTGLHDLYEATSPEHPREYPFGDDGLALAAGGVPRALSSASNHQRELFRGIKGELPLFVPLDFTRPDDGFTPVDYGQDALIRAILRVAPDSMKTLVRHKLQADQASAADAQFQQHHLKILFWAAGAAAVGAAPVVGLVTVPAAQAGMLAQLAKEYGVEWGAKDVAALAGLLGAAIVANQGALLVFRQLTKIGVWMIPLGAAQDYAVTYALGRAACVYFQSIKDDITLDADQIKAAFHDGLKRAFAARSGT
jgi:uncharacterized protein (DUF697 family)